MHKFRPSRPRLVLYISLIGFYCYKISDRIFKESGTFGTNVHWLPPPRISQVIKKLSLLWSPSFYKHVSLILGHWHNHRNKSHVRVTLWMCYNALGERVVWELVPTPPFPMLGGLPFHQPNVFLLHLFSLSWWIKHENRIPWKSSTHECAAGEHKRIENIHCTSLASAALSTLTVNN